MVYDCHPSCPRPIDLMYQHLRSTIISVIGDHASLLQRFLAAIKHLQQLRGLRPRSSTHVQDYIFRVDVQEERRKHGDQLLPGDKAGIETFLEVFVQIVEQFAFFEDLLCCVDLVQDIARVPRKDLQFRDLFGLMLSLFLLLHLLLLSFLFLLLLPLYLSQHVLQEIWILNFQSKLFVIWATGIDPKNNGQFFFHCCPEDLKFLLRQLQLQLIVSPE